LGGNALNSTKSPWRAVDEAPRARAMGSCPEDSA
jgi:hypothetical protein